MPLPRGLSYTEPVSAQYQRGERMRLRRSLLLGVVAPLFIGCSEPLAPDAARVELVLQASTTGDAHHPVRVSARAVNSGARAIWHLTTPPRYRGLWRGI